MADDKEDMSLKDLFGRTKETGHGIAQDTIINHIFVTCAGENNTIVHAEKLISFITPFLKDNTTAVDKLRKTMDPNNLNQEIDLKQFYILMDTWISAIPVEDDPHNITPRDSHLLTDVSFTQSTPKSAFGHHKLKECIESGIMNASISPSSYSINEFCSTNKGPEKTILEEQIQELEFQKKRMSEEMDRMKSDLANSLETNENMQVRLDQALKKVVEKQKLVDQLQQSSQYKDDNNEIELEKLRKHTASVNMQMMSLELKMTDMNEELAEIKVENDKLEKENQRLSKEKDAWFEDMIRFQNEIEVLKRDYALQQEFCDALNEKNKNLHDCNEEHTCAIEKLKFEKTVLENLLKPITKRTPESKSNLTTTFVRSNSMSEYSPIAHQVLKKHIYNTPKTMYKLKNPITPILSNEKIKDFNAKFASTSTPEEDIRTKSLMDAEIPKLNNTDTVLIPLKSEDFDSMSPPVMYVIERSGMKCRGDKNRYCDDFIKCESGGDLEGMLDVGNTNDYLEGVDKPAIQKNYNFFTSDNSIEENFFETDEQYPSIQSEIKDVSEISDLNPGFNIQDMNEEINVLRNKLQELSDFEEKYHQAIKEIEELKSTNDEIKKLRDRDVECLKENENEKLQIENQVVKLKESLEGFKKNNEAICCNLVKIKNEKVLLQNEYQNLQISHGELREMFEINKKELDVVKINNEICEQKQTELNRENEKLLNELDECNNSISYYKTINDKLTNTKNDLEKKVEENDELINVINVERISLNENNELLRQEKEKLKETINEFQIELKQKETKINFVDKELILLKESKDSMNKKIVDYEEMCENYKNKIENMGILVQNLEVNLKNNDLHLKNQELNLNQFQKENEKLLNGLDECNNTISYYKNINDTLTNTKKDLEQIVEGKDELINAIKVEMISLKENNELFRQEKEKLKETVNEFQIELKQKETKIIFVDKELILLKESKDSMNKKLVDCEEMCENYKNKIENLGVLVENLQVNLKNKDLHLKNQELNLNQFQKEIDNYKNGNEKLLNELDECNNTISYYKTINDKLTNTKNDLEKIVEEKDVLINVIKVEMISLKENNESLRQEKEKLKETITEFQIELKQKESKINFVDKELILLKETKDSMNNKLVDYEENCENYKNKIENLGILVQNLEINLKNKDLLLKNQELNLNQFQKEIDNYKKENENLKIFHDNEITKLLNEKKSILKRLKRVESGEMDETETGFSANLRETKKKVDTKRSNYDKLKIKNDKLEQKIFDLEDKLSIQKKLLADSVNQRKLIEDKLQNINEQNHQLEEQLTTITSEKENINVINTEIEKYTERLTQKRGDLEKNTLSLSTYFSFPNDLVQKFLITETSCLNASESFLKFEKQILNVIEQMEISSNVLSYLCTTKSKITFKDQSSQTEIIEERENIKSEALQMKGTLALKPATPLPQLLDRVENIEFASSGNGGLLRNMCSKQQENEDNELQAVSKCLCVIKSSVTETNISPRPRSRIIGMVSNFLIGWIIFMGIFLFMMLLIIYSSANLPCGYNCIDNPWIPFMEKRYIRNPPT